MAKDSPQDLKNKAFFSKKFNDLLEKSSKKQADISRDLDIPKSTLTGYVKGTSLPTAGNVQKIADYFKIKKSDLDLRFQTPNITPTSLILSIYNSLEPSKQEKVLDYAKKQLSEQRELEEHPMVNAEELFED